MAVNLSHIQPQTYLARAAHRADTHANITAGYGGEPGIRETRLELAHDAGAAHQRKAEGYSQGIGLGIVHDFCKKARGWYDVAAGRQKGFRPGAGPSLLACPV